MKLKTTAELRDSIRAQRSINEDAANLAADIDTLVGLLREAQQWSRSIQALMPGNLYKRIVAALGGQGAL